MKRLLVLLAVLLPNCTGCVGYIYPEIVHVPELVVDNRAGSVYAFRIDVDKTERPPNAATTQYTLARIPVDPRERGVIPGQLEIAPATGVLNPFGLDGVTQERNEYTMLVRAYCPGQQTIEVKAWDKPRELQWLPAKDLLAQEKAIDDLLADPNAPATGVFGVPHGGVGAIASRATWWDLKAEKNGKFGLQPGSVSSLHRQALQFASSEYQRLASSPAATTPANQAVRERLQQKAIQLRIYADQAP